MIIQNIWDASESYTHQNWIYKDVCVNFSRLYYIIDGEAYYEENGKKIRLKKGCLYLTPVDKCFTLYENPEDKLFHTFTHIRTFPAVEHFTEIRVAEGSPLADAIALWRKYIHTDNSELLSGIIQFLLSCIGGAVEKKTSVAEQTKEYLDQTENASINMAELSRTLGYSREHITREFRATYHMTPKQYFNLRVMNVALEKLISGAKVYEVAEALNYSTAYAFSKAFKKRFGLSPEKYIRTLNREAGRL